MRERVAIHLELCELRKKEKDLRRKQDDDEDKSHHDREDKEQYFA